MRPSKFNEPMTYYADKWGITTQTVSNLARKGCDFDADEKDVARWMIANCKRKPAKMTAAINEILKPTPLKQSASESDTATLEQLRDYYSKQLNMATKEDDVQHETVKFWNDLLLKTDESIRRSEAHAKKLGIDSGELLSRSEVERIWRALLWAGNACCDKFAKQMAQRLSNKSPAEVYELLAPYQAAASLFGGMKKITTPPGQVNVPDWLVDCHKHEEAQYLDDE